MAPTREILDSEDEGSEFSAMGDAIGAEGVDFVQDAVDATDAATEVHLPREAYHETTTRTSSLKSTDPSFFERIYDEQRAFVANVQHNATNSPPAPDGVPSQPQPPSQTKASSSLTTITDPIPPSHQRQNKREVVDLTQNATPSSGVANAEASPWDVPSSPLPRSMDGTANSASKVARTYGKRKRASQQTASLREPPVLSQDPYELPSTADPSPVQTRKRTKRGTQSSSLAPLSEDAPPAVATPQTEEVDTSRRRPTRRSRGATTSSMDHGPTTPESNPGLYIAPSALTASQKRQYQLVSLSSEPGQDAAEPALPARDALGPEMQKSSMATTIPYSTPSRFASSEKRMLPSDDSPSTVVYDVHPRLSDQHPQSSPDVISEEPRRPKRGRPQEPPLETRSAKKKRIALSQSTHVYDGEGEDSHIGEDVETGAVIDDGPQWAGDDDVFPRGLEEDQDSTAMNPNCESVAFEEMPELAIPAPKKKRGRKKKEVVILDDAEEPLLQPSEEAVDPVKGAFSAGEPEPEPEPEPVKRRRGRPRKSAVQAGLDTFVPEPPAEPRPRERSDGGGDIVDDDVTRPDAPVPALTAKPGRRGRKKSEVSKPATQGREEEADTGSGAPLVEISHNSRPSSGSVTDARIKEINASDEEDDDNDIHDHVNEDVVTKEDVKKAEGAKKPDPSPPPAKMENKGGLDKTGDNKETEKGMKEVKKPTTAAAVPPKVSYRVGLSKRSRIAPLLKSLRK